MIYCACGFIMLKYLLRQYCVNESRYIISYIKNPRGDFAGHRLVKMQSEIPESKYAVHNVTDLNLGQLSRKSSYVDIVLYKSVYK